MSDMKENAGFNSITEEAANLYEVKKKGNYPKRKYMPITNDNNFYYYYFGYFNIFLIFRFFF